MFSHLHMVGSGAVDYGWLGILPISIPKNENLTKIIGEKSSKRNGFRSAFSHNFEVSEPGYYKVLL